MRGETLGPLVRDQLRDLFGTHRLTITPVIHEGTEHAVDSYEIPDRIRESVLLRDVCEVFPHSSRAARRLDLDHTIPYTEGEKDQTRPANLGPLSRTVHRAKNHRPLAIETAQIRHLLVEIPKQPDLPRHQPSH